MQGHGGQAKRLLKFRTGKSQTGWNDEITSKMQGVQPNATSAATACSTYTSSSKYHCMTARSTPEALFHHRGGSFGDGENVVLNGRVEYHDVNFTVLANHLLHSFLRSFLALLACVHAVVRWHTCDEVSSRADDALRIARITISAARQYGGTANTTFLRQAVRNNRAHILLLPPHPTPPFQQINKQ